MINIFIQTMDQITVCNVNVSLIVMNPQRIITRLCSSPHRYSIVASFSSLFWVSRPATFLLWFTLCSHQKCCQMQQALVFSVKALETRCELPAST